MSRPAQVAVGILSVVVGAGLVTLLRPESPAGPPPGAGNTRALSGAGAGVDSSTPAAPSSRLEPPDLAEGIDAFLGGLRVAPFPRPRTALEQARSGELGPIDYRLQLERALRAPDAPLETARMLLDMEHDGEAVRFQTALALSRRLDADSTRALLDGLTSAPAAVRPQVVFALRGSPDDEVSRALVDLYAADPDEAVRAQAAFALGERGDRLAPLLLERARQRARDDLRRDEPRTIQAAADVLGTPPLTPADRQLLEQVLASDPDSRRRLAAWRALASAQVPAAELAPLLERVAQDPTASEELRAQVTAALRALQAPPGPPEGEGER